LAWPQVQLGKETVHNVHPMSVAACTSL